MPAVSSRRGLGGPVQAASAQTRQAPRRQRQTSPLNQPAWRLGLAVAAGCALACLLHQIAGPGRATAVWFALAPAAFAWVSAIRLLLLDTRWRRFWIIWLMAGLALIPATGGSDGGWGGAAAFSVVFLLLRRYKPYRHLTSARRAKLFALGLVALACLGIGWEIAAAGAPGAAPRLASGLLRYLLLSLQLFWVVSAWHLIFGMRLHFMRLKPKLATSAVFLALLPLLLIVLLWIVVLFSALGASRANSARVILSDWAELAARDETAARVIFAAGFRATAAGAAATGMTAGATEAEVPQWWPRLAAALEAAGGGAAPAAGGGAAPGSGDPPRPADDAIAAAAGAAAADTPSARAASAARSLWAPVDTVGFFAAADQLWVLALRGIGTPAWSVSGFRVDQRALDHLAGIVRAQVRIYNDLESDNRPDGGDAGGASANTAGAARADTAGGAGAGVPRARREGVVTFTIGGSSPAGGAESGRSDRPALRLRSTPPPQAGEQGASSESFWSRQLGFGAALLNVIALTPQGLTRDQALLHLLVSPEGLTREFRGRENEFNRGLVIALAVLAGLLLVIEAFAVFLGVRIVGGITSAVKTLHLGTTRLARGDLDTRIEVPNEDEFGDLADSFNEMTEAVKRGRDEAIAREQLERELRTAREIQEALLPHRMPEMPGFEISGTSVPSLQVGGDYFDFLDLGQERLGIAIGDVSGKGIPAALLMANLQACLQGQVIHPSGVAEIVARINDLLVRSTDASRFASFFYGVLDRGTGTFTFTNAGHNPPVLLRASGGAHRLEAGGLLLGLLPGQVYAQETVSLGPGDVIVLYTDGITEAIGPEVQGEGAAEGAAAADPLAAGPAAAGAGRAAGAAVGNQVEPDEEDDEDEEDEDEGAGANFFGEQRLLATVQACGGLSAVEIQAAVLQAVARHTAGIPQSDDITLVVIKRLSSAQTTQARALPAAVPQDHLAADPAAGQPPPAVDPGALSS